MSVAERRNLFATNLNYIVHVLRWGPILFKLLQYHKQVFFRPACMFVTICQAIDFTFPATIMDVDGTTPGTTIFLHTLGVDCCREGNGNDE